MNLKLSFNFIKTPVVLIIVSIFTYNTSSAQIGNCGPVDYNHMKILDDNLYLDSWSKDINGPFESIIKLSASWWKAVPYVNGWPSWCTASILDNHYKQSNGAIPGSVCAFAIISCLKYYYYTGDTTFLNLAKKTGDYIIEQDLTPSTYCCYPNFPYAVGSLGNVHPTGSGHPDSVSIVNPVGHIQPDKGAMVGVALLDLFKVTESEKYLNTSINIADCLSKNVVKGTKDVSPWPMRVMADSGQLIDGEFSTNVSYACRLFDGLLSINQTGNGLYKSSRDSVWIWLKTYVISSNDGSKWLNFFEDHSGDENNSLQLNALETVRYLLEKKEIVDSDWLNLSIKIINQVQKRWVLTKLNEVGYNCIAEQDQDQSPYNSHTARFGSILAMLYEAGASTEFKDIAYHSLCYGVYSVEKDGFTNTYYKHGKGTWTSDSFGDFLRHYIDAFAAIPEWAGNGNHLLKSSSCIKKVTYDETNAVTYTTFDKYGTEKLKLVSEPNSVTVDGKSIITYFWDTKNRILIINRLNGSNVIVKLASVLVNSLNEFREPFIVFYPNPVKNNLIIKVMNLYNDNYFSITDLNGKILYNGILNAGQNSINVSMLNSGIYILRISNHLEMLVRKIIKQ